jgi:hypothetical protein
VADPAADYNRLVEADPGAAREQAQWLEDAFGRAGITFDGAPMRTCLRPHFVAQAEWDSLRKAGRRLMEIAARVARRVFGGDVGALCAYLGTPEAEARWVRLDPGPPDVLPLAAGRVPGSDGPRFIEINSDAPAGFGYGDRMAEVFADLPLFRSFAETRRVRYEPSLPALVEAVVWAWRKTGRPAAATPVIAIADWADVKTRADQEIVCARFEAVGFDCVLADPRAMEVSGGRLVANGRPVDLVYRRAVLTEIVEREGQMQPFLDGLPRRARRLRELLPLPPLRGQGLLRDPDRRVVRLPDEPGGIPARAAHRPLDAPRRRAQGPGAAEARSTSCRT